MRSSWALVTLLVACGAPHRRASAPAPTQPDRAVERRLRLDAARYLGCDAAATVVALDGWSEARGTYVARGCGFEVTYLVACDAPDRCGYTPASDPVASP